MTAGNTIRKRAVWMLVLLAGVGGFVLWLDPFGPPTVTIHVRVLDARLGTPLGGIQVRGRHDETWRTVPESGRIVLDGVRLPPDTPASATEIARLLDVNDRYTVKARALPDVTARDDGDWDAVLRVERFGLLTIRIAPTVLPNVRAYLETSDTVRAVPQDGRGVARLVGAATYRVFPGPDRVPVVLKGDMGVAMARWHVLTPAPGTHLQRLYAAIAATPVLGRVTHVGAHAPPTLSGRLTFEPHDWRSFLGTAEVDVWGPLDPVRIQPDGSFLAPHLSPGTFDLFLDLDFLGRVPLPTPTRIKQTNPELALEIKTTTSWLSIVFPKDNDARHLTYEITRTPPCTTPARIVTYEGVTYAVLPEPGAWQFQIGAPGTDDQPPRISETRVDVTAPGAGELQSAFRLVPSGTLTIQVPDAVRKRMRGATVRIDTGREATLLANLTRQSTLKNLRAGKRHVEVVWRDESYAPFHADVVVKAGGTITLVVKRQARAE